MIVIKHISWNVKLKVYSALLPSLLFKTDYAIFLKYSFTTHFFKNEKKIA